MRDFVTIVSGLPRSGTSLMMQMLAAGGMPVLTDGVRAADEDNPRGYLEFEAVKRTRQDSSWLNSARGKAVKMVYLLLRDLPPTEDYRVILMHRDLTEVLASQRAMLLRLGNPGADLSDAQMASLFRAQLQSTTAWLQADPRFRLLETHYQDCLRNPARAAAQVNEFLGGHLDETAMAAAVDPALYRRVNINAELS